LFSKNTILKYGWAFNTADNEKIIINIRLVYIKKQVQTKNAPVNIKLLNFILNYDLASR
jgi:hypothetical protein